VAAFPSQKQGEILLFSQKLDAVGPAFFCEGRSICRVCECDRKAMCQLLTQKVKRLAQGWCPLPNKVKRRHGRRC